MPRRKTVHSRQNLNEKVACFLFSSRHHGKLCLQATPLHSTSCQEFHFHTSNCVKSTNIHGLLGTGPRSCSIAHSCKQGSFCPSWGDEFVLASSGKVRLHDPSSVRGFHDRHSKVWLGVGNRSSDVAVTLFDGFSNFARCPASPASKTGLLYPC